MRTQGSSKYMTVKDNGPHPVDVYVGSRLKKRRSLMGISQEKLADAVGLTFQQVQKYERGANRVSASRLYQFSQILEVPVSFFYEGFSDSSAAPAFGLSDNDQEGFDTGVDEDIFEKKETIKLLREYYSIPDPKLRADFFKMIKSMADSLKKS